MACLEVKCGYIDVHGTFVISPKYADAEPFFQGHAKVKRTESDSQWATIDRAGNLVR